MGQSAALTDEDTRQIGVLNSSAGMCGLHIYLNPHLLKLQVSPFPLASIARSQVTSGITAPDIRADGLE